MYRNFLGKIVDVEIDRPLGSVHPIYSSMVYPINYGFIPGSLAGDGKEVDVFVLGVKEPLKQFKGKCIALVHRLNDNEDKLVVAPEGILFTEEEIRTAIHFQEKYFESEIILAGE